MIDEYIKARKTGEKEYKTMQAKGEAPYLPSLDDILPDNETMSQQSLGLMEIPVEMIVGTKTKGRQNSFAPNFMPLLAEDTEFAIKWSNLYRAQMEEGFNSPIKVYEYLHRFYVQEGNKRVSVSRFLSMPTIMADVIRIIPSDEVLDSNPDYAEFLEFYRSAPIYDIECSKKGSYREIASLMGNSLDERWPDDTVKNLRAAYWRFTKVMKELGVKIPGTALGDAFAVYLRIFTGDVIGTADSDKEVGRKLRRIQKELYTAQNEERVSLVESADVALNAGGLITKAEKAVAGPGSLASKVIPSLAYSEKNPLKAAFIYDRMPGESNWVYNHEAGRKRLGEAYKGAVITRRFIASQRNEANGTQQKKEISGALSAGSDICSFEDAVDEAARWGADVIFTTSVRQSDDTLRAAIKYPDIIFLNCSVNLAHQAVRTYYAKLYEAKFLAGIVAGTASAADGSHMIGYCSDYPIYGTIAAINAFAIGAAMTDPKVKIYLDWSGRQDNNWWWSMVNKGIHVISAIDSTHNTDGSNAYGVCYVDRVAPGEGTDLSGECRITNLAAPIWKWGRLYEIIIKTIIDGSYRSKLVDKKDQATNYWWGMISGVVDIEMSEDLPAYTKQLVGILRRDIINGSMNPFDGELRSQEKLIRRADDRPLSSMDVITMDWLNENVIGEIPSKDTLTDVAKETVSVSGVKDKSRE